MLTIAHVLSLSLSPDFYSQLEALPQQVRLFHAARLLSPLPPLSLSASPFAGPVQTPGNTNGAPPPTPYRVLIIPVFLLFAS